MPTEKRGKVNERKKEKIMTNVESLDIKLDETILFTFQNTDRMYSEQRILIYKRQDS